ncbi:MAG TPA: Rieske (2Fe-2S) protein [Candidatus Dormibacteraeota bacterium]|nr:Rieske (2Fe-2S) protein [Candidatus Dormibacteraeota bacterium]
MKGRESRVDRIVSDLLRGRRLKLRGTDAEEKEAIIAAARLAGARQGPQRMHAAFRKRLQVALERAPAEGTLTRRMALVAGLGLAAGVAGGALLEKAQEATTPRVAGGEAIDPLNGAWVDVAGLDELVEGHPMRVTAGGVSAYVFRRGTGVAAVSSICSHLPCELWWDGAHDVLACPCHPASFTTEGKSTATTYPLPALNTVRARVTANRRVEVLGTA